eukprot:19156-Eustigmatos_ZCMA.PRE.1
MILAHSAAVAAPWAVVLRLLEDAMDRGVASNYVCTMALKGLRIRKNWKAAVALINFMRER